MYIHNCPQCGQQYSTEEKVSPVKCPYCGTEINVSYPDEPQQQPQQVQQVQQPQQPQQPQPAQQPQQQYQQPGYQQTGYQQPGYQQPYNAPRGNIFDNGPSGKSRGVAGLLAILLGAFGAHYFYVGKTTPAIVFLLVTLLTFGFAGIVTGIISLIQGIILMASTSEADFENKWINPANSFPFF